VEGETSGDVSASQSQHDSLASQSMEMSRVEEEVLRIHKQSPRVEEEVLRREIQSSRVEEEISGGETLSSYLPLQEMGHQDTTAGHQPFTNIYQVEEPVSLSQIEIEMEQKN